MRQRGGNESFHPVSPSPRLPVSLLFPASLILLSRRDFWSNLRFGPWFLRCDLGYRSNLGRDLRPNFGFGSWFLRCNLGYWPNLRRDLWPTLRFGSWFLRCDLRYRSRFGTNLRRDFRLNLGSEFRLSASSCLRSHFRNGTTTTLPGRLIVIHCYSPQYRLGQRHCWTAD